MPDRFREDLFEPDRKELAEGPAYRFELDRREWVATVGAGLLVTAAGRGSDEPRPRGGRKSRSRRACILARDGSITVLTGKVEVGQGSRTEILQAAAEELRVEPEALRVMLADTAVTPDDGSTAGSRTTPSTVPVVRRACAAAREMLVRTAAEEWSLETSELQVKAGAITSGDRKLAYADLARSKRLTSTPDDRAPRGVPLTQARDWTVMGRTLLKAEARDYRNGRPPLSLGHRASGHALRRSAASSEVRRNSRERRPQPRERGWRRNGSGRGLRRLRR